MRFGSGYTSASGDAAAFGATRTRTPVGRIPPRKGARICSSRSSNQYSVAAVVTTSACAALPGSSMRSSW